MCGHNSLSGWPNWTVFGPNQSEMDPTYEKNNQFIKMWTTQFFMLFFISLRYIREHTEVNHDTRTLKNSFWSDKAFRGLL